VWGLRLRVCGREVLAAPVLQPPCRHQATIHLLPTPFFPPTPLTSFIFTLKSAACCSVMAMGLARKAQYSPSIHTKNNVVRRGWRRAKRSGE
jgi:hypothetical protein